MKNRTTAERARLSGLRESYEVAYRRLSSEVGLYQSLSSQVNSDAAAVEESRRLVEEAQAGYRESRNRLVEFMLAASAETEGAAPGAGPASGRGGIQTEVEYRARVEKLAYVLWVEAGRPGGTADADWRRAEKSILGEKN